MDVVWLKRDLRLHDHGPLAEAAGSTKSAATVLTTQQQKQQRRPFIILYLYEPDQLSHETVHGSHFCFVNESLIDLDSRLATAISHTDRSAAATATPASSSTTTTTNGRATIDLTANESSSKQIKPTVVQSSVANLSKKLNHCNTTSFTKEEQQKYTFQCITVVHAGAVYTLDNIHREPSCPRIQRILAHEETGHLKSYARDKAVRRWCRSNHVEFVEYNQSGVTRCLSNRDDFSDKFNQHLNQPLHNSIQIQTLSSSVRQRFLHINFTLYGHCRRPLQLEHVTEIPSEYRVDRSDRQTGGETKALATFQSFLTSRGANYSSGISSPNSSWTTGSRLSPYLTWGNISLRYVIQTVRNRQIELRATKKKQQQKRKKKTTNGPSSISNEMDATPPPPPASSLGGPCPWLRSLSTFSSRMHWRAHFIQKLESEPEMEKYDLCKAYQPLRRQPNDWNESYYQAWSSGKTGYPFVDACMRCLIRHGWLNFRMRAMLVSFATYNLWLDWKRIAPHLARLFLDYEPGIHYPQLQMQAGTTGINAMRVYNVTKQGIDQDPQGTFIRKYVPELQHLPKDYIHEPWKMPLSVQKKFHTCIGNRSSFNTAATVGNNFVPKKQRQSLLVKAHGIIDVKNNTDPTGSIQYYPNPIVDEKETAKKAKEKVAEVRKQLSTKRQAEQVFVKHGSRNARNAEMNGITRKALSSTTKRIKVDDPITSGQRSIKEWSSHQSHEQLLNIPERNNTDSKTSAVTPTATVAVTSIEKVSQRNNSTTNTDDEIEIVPMTLSRKKQNIHPSSEKDREHERANSLIVNVSTTIPQIPQNQSTAENKPPSSQSSMADLLASESRPRKGKNNIEKKTGDSDKTTIRLLEQQTVSSVSTARTGTISTSSSPPQLRPSPQRVIQKESPQRVIQKESPVSLSSSSSSFWNCSVCTFLNDKPFALACLICGTIRQKNT